MDDIYYRKARQSFHRYGRPATDRAVSLAAEHMARIDRRELEGHPDKIGMAFPPDEFGWFDSPYALLGAAGDDCALII